MAPWFDRGKGGWVPPSCTAEGQEAQVWGGRPRRCLGLMMRGVARGGAKWCRVRRAAVRGAQA